MTLPLKGTWSDELRSQTNLTHNCRCAIPGWVMLSLKGCWLCVGLQRLSVCLPSFQPLWGLINPQTWWLISPLYIFVNINEDINRKTPSCAELPNFLKLVCTLYCCLSLPSTKQRYYWPFDSRGGERRLPIRIPIWHPACPFSSSEKQAQDESVSEAQWTMLWTRSYCSAALKKIPFFWQKHSSIYFPSRGTLQSPQTISCLITAQEFVMSDFSYLLASFSALFNVSFNKTYWHGVPCCTTGSCPKYSRKQVSRLNKVKIRTVLKGISKAHVYMLNETGYNDFLSIKDSFQLWVVMIFLKIIIITSQKTLAAVGILTLPNYTANKGSRENVRVKWRPTANPNTLDLPLSKWAGQKPSGSCQRGMRLWNELPTDC